MNPPLIWSWTSFGTSSSWPHFGQMSTGESLDAGFKHPKKDVELDFLLAPAAQAPLRHQDVDVRVPFHVPAERVEERYEAEPPFLLPVGERGLAPQKGVEGPADGIEKRVEQRLSEHEEVFPQLEWHENPIM